MELLRVEAADPAKAASGLGNALLDRFAKKPTPASDWEFVHWAVTAVCRTDATLAKRHVSTLFLKLIGMLSTVDNHGTLFRREFIC